MSDPNQPINQPQPSVIKRFFSHVLVMPRWHKSVLTIALVLGGAGVAGHVAHFFSPTPKNAATTETATPGSKIVETGSSTTDTPANTEESFLVRNAPALTRVGAGCIAGFVIGWLFRAFIKLMSLLTLAGAVLFAGLSYFHVMNVDFSAAKVKYDSSITWVSDQAGKLKDATLAHIPASGSSVLGMFLGFRRRKF